MTLPERLPGAVSAALGAMAEPGDHFTGAEKLAIAAVARGAFAGRHQPPWMRATVEAGGGLDADVVDGIAALDADVVTVVRTIAADLHQVDRAWATTASERLGAGAYVEIVALVASLAIVDAFAEALGVDADRLPVAPQPGDPARTTPDDLPYDVGDIGAYVPMQTPWPHANVGRALTLSPSGNEIYRSLAGAMYHDGDFYDLAWERTLSRPHTEVLATAVSAAHECFY